MLRTANVYLRGLIALVIAIAVTLGGALVIVGLLSTLLTMTEIDRFLGVKYVLALPPLIALGLYFFTDRFGAKHRCAHGSRDAGARDSVAGRARARRRRVHRARSAAATRATSRRRRSNSRCART